METTSASAAAAPDRKGKLVERPAHPVEVTSWLLEACFFTLDARGAITMWSPPAAEAFGWSRSDIVRSTFTDTLLAPEHREAHTARLRALFDGAKEGGFRAEAEAVDASGQRLRVAFAAVPIHVGVGYEFNGLLQEVASSARSAQSLAQLKSRDESVLALIDDALSGKHASAGTTDEAGRLAGALVVFRVVGPRQARPDGEPDPRLPGGAAGALIDDALAERERLRGELTETQARLDALTSERERVSAETERLRGDLADVRRRASDDLTHVREEAAAEADRLLKELAEARRLAADEAKALHAQLSEASAASEAAKRALAATEAKLDSLAREAEDLRRELRESRAELARHSAESEAAQARDEALRTELASLSAEAAEAKLSSERLRAELEGARADAVPVPGEAPVDGELAARLEMALREADEARAQARAARSRTEASHEEAVALGSRLEQAGGTIARLEAELTAAHDLAADADRGLADAQRELARRTSELEAATVASDALRAQIAALSEEAAQARADAEQARATSEAGERSREEAARSHVELDRARADLAATRESADASAATVRAEIARLGAELEAARTELAIAHESAARTAAQEASRPAPASAPDQIAKQRVSAYLDELLTAPSAPVVVAAADAPPRTPVPLPQLQQMARETDARNAYTRGHSERVARYAVAVAEVLGFERERVEALSTAALVHDVGKSELPDALIAKDDPLNLEELDELARHSEIGREMLVAAGEPTLAEWVRHVHERFDGAGYPLGLAGPDIPLESRILHAADALDHMTRARAYRRDRPQVEALAELAFCAGTRLDAEIVTRLVELVETSRLTIEASAPERRRSRRSAPQR